MKTVILTVLMFGIIITLHETGHFMFAKLFGVRVNEFSFGMGPKLFQKRKGETDYSIRLFPIGGYVAMDGEDGEDDEDPASLDERAFCNKKPWQRFIILFAGAGMNILLGLVVLIMLSSRMELLGTNVVAKVAENAPAQNILLANDKIMEVNGHSTKSYNDVIFQMIRDEDGKIDLTVKRITNLDELNAKAAVTGSASDAKIETVLLKDVPFKLTEGENGHNVIDLGLNFYGVENSFINTMKYSYHWTISIVKQVWFSLVDIVTGKYGINEISGPVGTAEVVKEASSQGMDSFFMLFAFITINIGVFNLLPIPALDGGRLFFLLIEIIFRKPIPTKYEAYIHATGMILLLGFIAVVTFNDILKLIR